MAPFTGKLTLIGFDRSSPGWPRRSRRRWSCPTRPRRRTEVIRGKGWEKIHRALILRTGRPVKTLVSVKVKAGRPNFASVETPT